jgi:hypothetical protein
VIGKRVGVSDTTDAQLRPLTTNETGETHAPLSQSWLQGPALDEDTITLRSASISPTIGSASRVGALT